MYSKNLGSLSVFLIAFVLILVSTTTNLSFAGCEHPVCSVHDSSDSSDSSDFSDFDSQPEKNQSLRLSRANMFSARFSSALPSRFATLWWRNLRCPSFCNMVLCHGACSWQGDGRHSACSLVPIFPVLPDQLLDSTQEAGLTPRTPPRQVTLPAVNISSCSGDRVF